MYLYRKDNHLVRAADHAQRVLAQELVDHLWTECEGHSAIVLSPARYVLNENTHHHRMITRLYLIGI